MQWWKCSASSSLRSKQFRRTVQAAQWFCEVSSLLSNRREWRNGAKFSQIIRWMNNFIIENNHFKLLQSSQHSLTVRGEREREIKNNFHFVSLHFRTFAFRKVFLWRILFGGEEGKFNLIQNHKPKFKIKTIENFFFPSFFRLSLCLLNVWEIPK